MTSRQIILSGNRGFYNQLGYHSATVASREGRTATQASGEAHAEYDRPKLINQSREFVRNNGIYRGMIERMTSYIIGNGFDLQLRTSDAGYNAAVEKKWNNFWRRPEIKSVMSGRRLERMVCRELLTVGDTGLIKTDTGKLQHIEAEQIVHKKFTDGIEKDKYGNPVNYFIAGYNKSGRVKTSEAQPYTPDNFLFLTEPDRPSSIRGVPPCQSCFPMLHRINDICDSEAIAWQLLARIAVSITRNKAGELAFNESSADPDASTTTDDKDLASRITQLDYALIFHGEPGDEIKGVEHNMPSGNFSQSLIMFLRLLGLPLGLPLEIILLDWTKSNYSQSRAVLEQCYQIFLGWQYLIEDFFLRPAFEWKLAQWIIGKEVPIGKDTDVLYEWGKPSFPWIDQLKEAQAYGAKIDRSFSTHAQVCRALDQDRGDVIRIREAEIREAIQIAQKIKADTGETVPWQIFAGMEEIKSGASSDNKDFANGRNTTNQSAGGDNGKSGDDDSADTDSNR